MQYEDHLKVVNLIKKQFLSNVPIKDFCLKDIDSNIELQGLIVDNTIRLDAVLKYPINVNYQKAFLKCIIEYLEKQGSVIHDVLYEEYGRLVALPCNNVYFKHYSTEKTAKNIVLKEDTRLISDGTTGLRTWQASLALSEWILSNTTHFNNKVILELGSGIGLTGLIISIHSSPKAVYLTDCHPSVLTTLCENIKLNIGSNLGTNYLEERCILEESVNSCIVRVLNLPWEQVTPELCKKLGQIDKIVAADVVYDKHIFNPLISAVDYLFKYCSTEQFILSCTERNTDTLSEFLSLLGKKYSVENIEVSHQKNFLWSDVPPVKIFSLTPTHK